MRKCTILFLIVALIVVAWTVFYYYNLLQVHHSCTGHIVKNIFDWPVCVH